MLSHNISKRNGIRQSGIHWKFIKEIIDIALCGRKGPKDKYGYGPERMGNNAGAHAAGPLV